MFFEPFLREMWQRTEIIRYGRMLISQLDFKTIFQSYTNFFSDLLLSSLFRILFLLPASYLNCHCKTLNGRCSALVRFGQQKSQFPMGISLGHSEGLLQRPKNPENPSSFQMNHSHHKFSFEIHNLSLSHKHNTQTHSLSLFYTHTLSPFHTHCISATQIR